MTENLDNLVDLLSDSEIPYKKINSNVEIKINNYPYECLFLIFEKYNEDYETDGFLISYYVKDSNNNYKNDEKSYVKGYHLTCSNIKISTAKQVVRYIQLNKMF